MWVFVREGYVSIVEDRLNPDILIVRARIKGDIEAVWPDAEVIHTPVLADYAFRARLKREEVAAGIADQVFEN
jgi:hypothetical protein